MSSWAMRGDTAHRLLNSLSGSIIALPGCAGSTKLRPVSRHMVVDKIAIDDLGFSK